MRTLPRIDLKGRISFEGRRIGDRRKDSVSLDLLFAALADPTRRDILGRLANGEMSVTQIARSYEISLPAISKHLNFLESAGLIVRRREGRLLYCEINATPLISAATWLGRYKKIWEGQLDSLGSYLDELKRREAKRDVKKV